MFNKIYYSKELSAALEGPKCKQVKESKAVQTRHTIPVHHTGTMRKLSKAAQDQKHRNEMEMMCRREKAEEAAKEAGKKPTITCTKNTCSCK